MFLKNAWYCAGWDYEISLGKDSLLARQMAGERVVLYRKLNGEVVALEDRCPHRQAALSMGAKEGDALRCMYHGVKFGPDGKCIEIPYQPQIPNTACVRAYPVVEKDSWIWVWMGDPAKADPALICNAVPPTDPDWVFRTGKLEVNASYRDEIENLNDFTHLTYVHRVSIGGAAYGSGKLHHKLTERGMKSDLWLYADNPPHAMAHLFPPGAKFDMHWDLDFTVPCNFILRFQAFLPGTRTEGPSDGQMVLDTWTCQAVTPRDAHWVDYYYSWGINKQTYAPGMTDMLIEAMTQAFFEDKAMLEGLHLRVREKPEGCTLKIKHDAGVGKVIWLLDKMLKEEADAESPATPLAASALA